MLAYDRFARVATDGLLASVRRREQGSGDGERDGHVPCAVGVLSAEEAAGQSERVRALEERSARISVLGPPSVETCAAAPARAAGLETQRYADQREQPPDAPTQPIVAEAEVREQSEHRGRFLAAARQALGTGPESGPEPH